MRMGWKGAALALLLAGMGAAIAQPAFDVAGVPRVLLPQGLLEGTADNGVESFRNIPFAAPPVGALRFAPPAAPVAWSGTRSARSFGPSCMQEYVRANGPFSDEYFAAPPFSEDCLQLNIWTTRGSGKAVLLYVPGGGFVQGGGNLAVYNGSNMAKADLVVVTMNYRLGAAGFLSYPGIPGDAHGTGNYALQDVMAALRWIKANIAAFGGDPAKVTIMGQSAGASAIVGLLDWPEARGLFRGAIIDSGVRANGGGPAMAPAAALEAGQAWAKTRGAADLAALRVLPQDALVPRNGDPRLAPGTAVAGVPIAVDVPVLTGWNSGEGAGSGPQPGLTAANYEQRLASAIRPGSAALAPLYPAGQDAGAALRRAGHDATMLSGAAWARAHTAATRSPLYYFDFEHVMPGYTAADWGAHHSSELPYVFGALDALAGRPYTATDRRVSQIMQAYFINFIKTGNPNGSDRNGGRLATWRPFDAAANEVMALGAAPRMRPLASPERLSAWRSIYN
jgi:para-nitrobenzyl esterase